MRKAAGIIGIIILVICAIPFLSPEVKIEWTIYLSIPFIILGGAVGFVTRRIEGVIIGMVLGAILPLLWQSFQTAISTLP